MAKAKSAPYKGNNFKGKDEDGEDQYQPRPNDFLDFQGSLVPVKFITRISPLDEYDYDKNCPVFKLVINPDPNEQMFFCNTYATFYSAEARDEFKERLKTQLYGCNMVFTDIS